MLPFSSTRRKPGWLAILPQGSEITLAHVVRERGDRPKVRLLDSFSVENDSREALRRLRHAQQLKSYPCTTLMAAGHYTVTQLDAPAVPREERKEALRWALKDVVNYPVETACVDVLDIPADGLGAGRQAPVLVVSAAEQDVRERAAVFEEAGVRLDAIDIPELAQRNVAALLEEENRGLAFLRVDAGGMMLTLTYRGELIAVRRGDMTSLQLNSGDVELRERTSERLVLELQRSLDNFDRQYSHMPVSRVVLAAYPAVENLATTLGENTYVPVQEMELSSVLDFSAVPELRNSQIQSRHLLAIGAALRSGEVAS